MSSAILYLAIIAIWACVLIPRWLKRDSARSAAVAEDATGPGQAATTEFADADATDTDANANDGIPDDAPAAPLRDARRRVLAARRRLLWMMLGLEAAGAALAATRLAAWWVIAPPTVMLAGYLLLLREAAQADASRREREATEAAQARTRERAERARLRDQARQATAAAPATPVPFAAAPVPEDYEDLGHGRDFTPSAGPGYRRYPGADDPYADDGAYDQYTENRLRAVGD